MEDRPDTRVSPVQAAPGQGKLLTIDQELYDALSTLNLEAMKPTLGRQLTDPEMKALLARRDRIIEVFDKAAAAQGREAVITPASSN